MTRGRAILADGGEATFDIHSVTVLLDGQSKNVDVYVSDTAWLVGMRLLDGYSVCVDVEYGARRDRAQAQREAFFLLTDSRRSRVTMSEEHKHEWFVA